MNNSGNFQGELDFISLADLFQILGENNSTGALLLKNDCFPYQGVIYFEKGNPVNATNGSLLGLKALYSLFGWIKGKFVFVKGENKTSHLIKQNRMQIVLDALRMLDDGLINKFGDSLSHGVIPINETNIIKAEKKTIIYDSAVVYQHIIEEEEFHNGDKIVSEGCYGNWVWVNLGGIVKVTKKTSKGNVIIANLKEGCFIGSLAAFLHGNNCRSATVTAFGEVHLGLLDSQRLSGEYTSLSKEFKGILLSLSRRLRGITNRVIDLHRKKYIPDGFTKGKQIIMKKGSKNKGLFTIKEGKIDIVGSTKKGDIPLLTLGRNDTFGYFPFMDFGHEPGNVLVLATKDIKAERVNDRLIKEEYAQLSGTLKGLISNVGTCICNTTKLAYKVF